MAAPAKKPAATDAELMYSMTSAYMGENAPPIYKVIATLKIQEVAAAIMNPSAGSSGAQQGAIPATGSVVEGHLQRLGAAIENAQNSPSALTDVFRALHGGRMPTVKELDDIKDALPKLLALRAEKLRRKIPDIVVDPQKQEKKLDKFVEKSISHGVKLLNNNVMRKCGGCPKEAKVFKRCARCKNGEVVYCSKECQTAQWPTHKLVCVIPTSGAGAGAGAGSAASKS